ncbi:hypothetical protein FA15DRAFT_596166 [Coprinopsis marcescibilis]|uniref:Uncharacterized protein n=1 Tax=Coprinopsis marcescibilis TaxID=230819 RepID=A0A5C3KQL0_COPMA|nr:hypothetical protein FA15DRAFT_596166 [Coprinopsis marcescibilis]
MGFCLRRVWLMGYGGVMGYGSEIPAHRPGGSKKVWVTTGYGFPRVWLIAVLTVNRSSLSRHAPCSRFRRKDQGIYHVKRLPTKLFEDVSSSFTF